MSNKDVSYPIPVEVVSFFFKIYLKRILNVMIFINGRYTTL